MQPHITNTVKNRTSGAASAATAIAANGDRLGFFIQNLDTAALFVKYGTGCSTSNYDTVLKGGAGAADGSGAAIMSLVGAVYTGIITVASAGTPSYVAYEL